jgi:hypothetical protein
MRLVKGRSLWVAERRGTVVFHRGGSASAPGVPKAKEFRSEALAQRFLETERDRRLAEGFVLTDPDAGLDTPFTPNGTPRERTVSPRFAHLAEAVRFQVRAGYRTRAALDELIDELVTDTLRSSRNEQTARRRAAMSLEDRLHDEELGAAVERDEDGPTPSHLAESLREVARAARATLVARGKPSPCINDALDAAFDALGKEGVIALQCAGFTQSDGWSDANEEAAKWRARGERPRGACFFHEQDVARAVKGDGLLLSFGAWEGDAVEIGREVVSTLRAHGIDVVWGEEEGERIRVLPFEWYRVGPPSPTSSAANLSGAR